jgi:hypothetical protein
MNGHECSFYVRREPSRTAAEPLLRPGVR